MLAAEGGGGTIFDLLAALVNLASTIVRAVVDLITPLLNLIANLIQLAFVEMLALLNGSLAIVLGFLQSLAAGVNAGPTDLSGLAQFGNDSYSPIGPGYIPGPPPVTAPAWIPNCLDPSSWAAGVCVGLYTLEYNIRSSPMMLMIGINFVLAAIAQLLWAAQKIIGILPGVGGE